MICKVDVHPYPEYQDSEGAIEKHTLPIQKVMVCFGLLYTETPKVPLKMTVSKLIHTMLFVLVCLNALRYFGAYHFGEKFDVPLLFKWTLHIPFMWGVCSFIAGRKISEMQPSLFRQWARYRKEYNVVTQQNETACFKKRTLLILTVSSGIVLVGGSAYISLCVDPLMKDVMPVFMLPFYDKCFDDRPSVLFVVMLLFIYFLVMGTSQIVLGYFILLVLALRDEFTTYNRDFESNIKVANDRTTFSGDLEHWRQRHRKVIHLVELLDEGLGMFVLLLFTSNIPMCCFLLYIIVMGQYPLDLRLKVWALILPVWFFCMSIMLVITYCGTKLNSEAIACKNHLYSLYLDGDEWTMSRHLQYRTFYQKLTEGHIGITGWKLFFINKTTVKMVVLLVMGYGLILLKFGEPTSSPLFTCSPGDATVASNDTDTLSSVMPTYTL